MINRSFESEYRATRRKISGGTVAIVVVVLLSVGVLAGRWFLNHEARPANATRPRSAPGEAAPRQSEKPKATGEDRFGLVAIDLDDAKVRKELAGCPEQVVNLLKDYGRQMEAGRFEEVRFPAEAQIGVAYPEDLLRLHLSVYNRDILAAWLSRRADHLGFQGYSQNYTSKKHPAELKIHFGSLNKSEADQIVAAAKMYSESGYKFDQLDPARRDLLRKWALFFDLE